MEGTKKMINDNNNFNYVWTVYWHDKNYKCHSVDIQQSEQVPTVWKALQLGTEQLKKQGCRIKKDYEVDIKILSKNGDIVEHIADF